MEFLSFAERDHAFGFTARCKVDSQRYHREATLLGSPDKTQEFVFVQKQFAYTFGGMVPYGGLSIFFDFTADQPEFAIFDASIRFFDRAFPVTKALHFAAVQYDSAFNGI